ncbi:MAG TPA: HD-GYP domain-containing protein [Symbiobacteriaceae bacterium]|nr:HD-GYP domain-containing protein [Symbiobacteriaceae bacterium]
MSKNLLRPLMWILTAVLLPLAVFAYLRLHAAEDPLYAAPHGHFYIVSGAAFLAAVAALIVGIAGTRLRNINVTFLSMAFSSLALVFLLHGLATPGFLLPVTQVPGIAAQLSILLSAGWLYLSSCPTDHIAVRVLSKWQRWLVPVWTTLLTITVVLGLTFPQAVRFIPIHLSPLKWIATLVVVVLVALAARHYWVAYRYARFPLQMALLISTGWMAASQVIIVTGDLWRASWWIYHFLLLGSMIATLYGLWRQYAMGATVGMAVKGLMSLDPVERIEAGMAPSIRALVVATETRDPYTAGHSYRVTIEALRLGAAMRVPPEQLRALAQGGILHDIGKIEVPDRILNKPGPLTAEERTVVERHPVTGYEVCKRLGFMNEELGVIRHHHEKWDGTGYPDGLCGQQIPLLARILAIADVYDAVTSYRSYRRPWPHEEAVALILRESGRHFDPDCVAAWVRISQAAPSKDHYPSWLHLEPAAAQQEAR